MEATSLRCARLMDVEIAGNRGVRVDGLQVIHQVEVRVRGERSGVGCNRFRVRSLLSGERGNITCLECFVSSEKNT